MVESKALTACNTTRGTCLATQVYMAKNFCSRLRGLLATKSLPAGRGLCLEGCKSIHMMGMIYAIDAIFIDQQWQVVGLVENIKPWRVSGFYRQAVRCLELPAGSISASQTQLGDQISLSST